MGLMVDTNVFINFQHRAEVEDMPMKTSSYRGVVRGGTVVLEAEAQLCEGTEVVVTPVFADRGSPAAVIAAAEAAPHVPDGWVDELEDLIAQGRRPPSGPELFARERSNGENP
jgi:hypothetical protein